MLRWYKSFNGLQVQRGARSKRNRIRRLAKIFIPRVDSGIDAKNVDGGKENIHSRTKHESI